LEIGLAASSYYCDRGLALIYFRMHFRITCISFRTASDLEEWGWIDKSQKGIVKDLIISGNQTIQAALEKFEKGDTKELEGLFALL
jgi:hypothetical protein